MFTVICFALFVGSLICFTEYATIFFYPCITSKYDFYYGSFHWISEEKRTEKKNNQTKTKILAKSVIQCDCRAQNDNVKAFIFLFGINLK